METLAADIAIIGSGPGGSTTAWALRDCGASVLVIERGEVLPREPANWDVTAVFGEGRYKTDETWDDLEGEPFRPGVHYWVGGNSKLWGTALPRFAPADFTETRHAGGISPAWPFGYDALEPYYEQAERLYGVHAGAADWGMPPRRNDVMPPVGHEPDIARFVGRLSSQGLHPFDLAVGIDLRPGGRCIRCATCDGFPCQVDAKHDAEMAALRPALEQPNVTLATGITIETLETTADGARVVRARGRLAGGPVTIEADRFVLSAGAANSAAVLLRSASPAHLDGLANSSGMVGRNYMHHVTSAVMAIDPRRKNRTRFQKSFAINDWYGGDADYRYPMGNVQGVNKLQPGMLAAAQQGIPRPVQRYMTAHSVDLWAQSEDLPDAENRVIVRNGRIGVRYRKTNAEAHEQLLRRLRRTLWRAGCPVVIVKRMGIATNSHQCGTCRAGTDSATSVLDPHCRSHDVENLWVVDSSFMPSSAAFNPGLTIAANAMRVAAESGLSRSR